MPLPPDTVRITIPAARLAELPPGASFHGRSGRASVDISRKGDTLRVYASCDSLQALCHYYERTSAAWQERYEQAEALLEEERERRTSPVTAFYIGFLAGILLSILLYIIIKKAKEKWLTRN